MNKEINNRIQLALRDGGDSAASKAAWLMCQQFPDWQPLLPKLSACSDGLRSIVCGDNRHNVKLAQIAVAINTGQTDLSADEAEIAHSLIREHIDLQTMGGHAKVEAQIHSH
jgi:hypothetical protein|tara:strand:+ start:969 stop:1304 length:336 start_codon:yes stop_codon:yes gene_type:complete